MKSTTPQISPRGPQKGTHRFLSFTVPCIFVHALVGFICMAELMALPRLIRIYEDQDALLPEITIIVIKVYAALRPVWFYMPIPVLGMLTLDAVILACLVNSQRHRMLGVLWFVAVLLWLLLLTGFVTLALLLPFRELS